MQGLILSPRLSHDLLLLRQSTGEVLALLLSSKLLEATMWYPIVVSIPFMRREEGSKLTALH